MSSYRDQERAALEEVALATLAAPTSPEDKQAVADKQRARRRLSETADLSRLDADELLVYEFLACKVFGRVESLPTNGQVAFACLRIVDACEARLAKIVGEAQAAGVLPATSEPPTDDDSAAVTRSL